MPEFCYDAVVAEEVPPEVDDGAEVPVAPEDALESAEPFVAEARESVR